MNYQIIKAGKEEIGLVWRFVKDRPIIERIFLPCPHNQLIIKINNKFSAINLTKRKISEDIAQQIGQMYSGSKINFNHSLLNYTKITKFSELVLRQTCKIPPGKVDTYSGLAAKIGFPGAARAVGNALANNPFPIIIPCHRVVRVDGSLGGFGGGIRMKRELLGKEGIFISSDMNRVSKEYFFAG